MKAYDSHNGSMDLNKVHQHSLINALGVIGHEPVEPVSIELLKGESQRSVIYRLTFVGMEYKTLIAKRCPQNHSLIERTIYEEILANISLPVPQYFGYVLEPEGEFGWFFLEDVGDEKYRSYIHEHRVAAAKWLGLLHTSTAINAGGLGLPERKPEYYLSLLQSANKTIQSNLTDHDLKVEDRSVVKSINDHSEYLRNNWKKFMDIDRGIPNTIVHGDFIENNVRIRTNKDKILVIPFDWEKAGWGIPAEDISNVDIQSYWVTVHEQWPDLSLNNLRWIAQIGKIYRCIVYLDWIAPRLANTSVEQPLADLRQCEAWLIDLLQAGKWRE